MLGQMCNHLLGSARRAKAPNFLPSSQPATRHLRQQPGGLPPAGRGREGICSRKTWAMRGCFLGTVSLRAWLNVLLNVTKSGSGSPDLSSRRITPNQSHPLLSFFRFALCILPPSLCHALQHGQRGLTGRGWKEHFNPSALRQGQQNCVQRPRRSPWTQGSTCVLPGFTASARCDLQRRQQENAQLRVTVHRPAAQGIAEARSAALHSTTSSSWWLLAWKFGSAKNARSFTLLSCACS